MPERQRYARRRQSRRKSHSADWRAAITIIVAALIGGLGGIMLGVEFLVGMVFGLAASGYITIAQNVAKK